MTNAIVVSQSSPVQTMSFQEIMTASDMVAKAGLFAGYDTPQKVATLMFLAQAEGRNPIEAMLRYDIIKGRPAKKPQAMLDDFYRGGGKVKWLETTAKKAKATFTPLNGDPLTLEYTIEQAATAGLAWKDTWKQYPDNMLRARLIGNAMRMVAPNATSGFYTPEEVEDMTPDRVNPVQIAARTATTNDVDALLSGKIPVASQDAPQPPDDPEPTNVPPTPVKPKDDPVPAAPVANSKPLTLGDKPEYMKGLHAVAAESGWTHEDISTYMKELGFASTKDFPFDSIKYKAVLDHIKANPFQKPTPPTEPTPEPPKPSTMDEPAPDKELDKQVESMKAPDKSNTLHNFPAQFGKLIEAAGKYKWGYSYFSKYVVEKYGVDNPRDLTLNQANEVMKYMEAHVGAGK